ncbi:unnamed protein product, partial [Amoebophrya sp. A120]
RSAVLCSAKFLLRLESLHDWVFAVKRRKLGARSMLRPSHFPQARARKSVQPMAHEAGGEKSTGTSRPVPPVGKNEVLDQRFPSRLCRVAMELFTTPLREALLRPLVYYQSLGLLQRVVGGRVGEDDSECTLRSRPKTKPVPPGYKSAGIMTAEDHKSQKIIAEKINSTLFSTHSSKTTNFHVDYQVTLLGRFCATLPLDLSGARFLHVAILHKHVGMGLLLA